MGLLEWYGGLKEGIQFMLLLAAAGTTITIAIIGFEAWRRVRTAELRAGLTRRMLDNGMTADEIVRVLATSKISEPTGRHPAANDPEVLIVEVLTGNHYEAQDVQRILTAARASGRVDDSTYGVVKSLAESWAETDNIVSVLEGRRTTTAPGPTAAQA